MDKRESLTARYERVLGRPLTDADRDDTPTEASETQPSASRRREQILSAQRTHRHRTQQYIRELEKEVFRLRDENDELRQRMGRMQADMSEMNAMLVPNGLQANTQVDSTSQQQNRSKSTETFERPSGPGTVQIDLTGLGDVIPEGSCENHPAEIAPPTYQPPATSNASPAHPHLPDSRGDQDSTVRHSGLNTQVGINFILTLEEPCLPHVKHAHMGYSTGTTPRGITYNSGPGHLLAASAMLTRRYNNMNLESVAINLPSTDIERLLEASGRLKLDGEVTPVQIWQRLQSMMAKSHGMGAETVEDKIGRLTEVFQRYVYCNSFGAVVQKATVECVLADVLGD